MRHAAPFRVPAPLVQIFSDDDRMIPRAQGRKRRRRRHFLRKLRIWYNPRAAGRPDAIGPDCAAAQSLYQLCVCKSRRLFAVSSPYHAAGAFPEPFRPYTVKKRKNGFSTVQKSIFYGSNPPKCCSEPYFSWYNTVKRSKNLFFTVPDSPKVRLQMRKSGIYPYLTALAEKKYG